jgi:hypothetical protein
LVWLQLHVGSSATSGSNAAADAWPQRLQGDRMCVAQHGMCKCTCRPLHGCRAVLFWIKLELASTILARGPLKQCVGYKNNDFVCCLG